MIIWAENYGTVGTVLSIGTSMAYLNKADPGYNAAIKAEFAVLRLNGTEYRFEGISQATFENPQSHPACDAGSTLGKAAELENGSRVFGCHSPEPKLYIRNPARIERVLLGASGTSHETVFAPARTDCSSSNAACVPTIRYLGWQNFLSTLKVGDKLTFAIGVSLIDGASMTKTCVLTITKPELVYLVDRGWHNFDHCES